ncbi:MAG TPA: RDD family protein [Gemmataceae bacterium]|nr:RDD family protein [Gemmataceae bacterium]
MIRHEVLTDEKVPFSYRVAGLGSRFLAWLVDLFLIIGLDVMGIFVGSVLYVGRPGLGTAVIIVWQFVLTWGYFLFFEWLWHGQTPGKALLGIRVIQWRGTAMNFFEAALRNILRFVDSLPIPLPLGPGLLGFVVAACNREHRRLGDLAANTLVVHVERNARPILALADAHSEADCQRLALLRQRLSQLDREQKQTLLDLCLRRDQLRVLERARLFQAASQFFQQRLDLAPDEYESAEKFVLQMAAVLGERPGEPPGLSRRG